MLFNVKPYYERLRGSSVRAHCLRRKGAASQRGSKSRVEGETTTTTSSSTLPPTGRVIILLSSRCGS